jgi:hypothetical protein
MEFHATSSKDIELVSGLEWRALSGVDSVDKELRQLAKYLDAKLHVSRKNGAGATLAGFLTNDLRSELPKKPHSLPMLLAGVPDIAPDCVFVLVEEDSATIAALIDGAPAPGLDGFGEMEEVLTAAQHFIRVAPQNVTVYGNCESLNPQPLSFEEIVEKSTTLKEAKLHGLAMSPVMRVAMLSAVLLVVGGLGKWGYDYNAQLRKMAATRLANVNPDTAYENAVTPLMQAAIPAKRAVPELSRILNDLVISEGGWDLININCIKDGCTFTWQNMAGTNRTFVVPPQVAGLKYSPKGDLVSYQMAYAKPLPIGVDTKNLLTLEKVWRDVIGDFQQYADLGIGREFSNPTNFAVPSTLLGTPQHVYKEGNYSVTAPWAFREVIEKLPDASTFGSLVISIDAEKRISFKLTGKYYVQ